MLGQVAFVLGVPVDDVTLEESVDVVFDLVDDGRASGRSHQVATVNVDFVVNARRDPGLLRVMQATSLSVPDGMPVVWAARAFGSPLRARTAGADLVPALVERAAATGRTVVLYGAAPGVAARAAAVLGERYPGARVIGLAAPMFRDVAELHVDQLAELRELDADICCVAFGNPKQEWFAARFGAALGIPVMIGVGGTVDFLVGEQRRAPVWMQRAGLEWLFRASADPRRLVRRYVTDAVVYLPAVVTQWWRGRRSRRVGEVVLDERDGRLVVDLGRLAAADNVAAARVVGAIRSAWRRGTPVEVVRGPDAALDRIPGLADVVDAAAAG